VPSIDPLASVHPDAQLHADVKVGPFSIIEEGTTIGAGCRIAARVSIKSGTHLGEGNHIFEGTVLGGPPQHLRAGAELGRLAIGDGNQFRENVTAHRGLEPGRDTVIGNGNFLMVAAHVGHDCQVGDNVIMANNAMLGGHVSVEDRAFLSGNVAVHQFFRVGMLAMVGAQARVTRDIPPYVMIDGVSSLMVGLNAVGLRRAGFGKDDIAQIKSAYRHIFRNGLTWDEALASLKAHFTSGPAARFYEFLNNNNRTRGLVQERRKPRTATLKLLRQDDHAESPSALRRAG
jgi:UDP-N-acetylglucosamine acyltransferase